MNPRIPFAAAVVGALLVGGATTGGTHASWASQRTLTAHQVQSGSMTSGGVASPAAVTVNRATSTTVDVTVTDGSAGKNLVQQVTPSVSATAGTASLVTKAAGTCTTTAQPAVDLVPSGSFVMCVRYTAPDTTATTATITVTLNGRQKRGGALTGWTAPPQTVTIPVTINQPAVIPSPPTLTCGSFQSNGVFSFSWVATAGTTYNVFRSVSTNADPSYSQATPAASTPYLASVPEGTSFWRVKAVNTAGTSPYSDTIRLVRNGNGSNSITCTKVTP